MGKSIQTLVLHVGIFHSACLPTINENIATWSMGRWIDNILRPEPLNLKGNSTSQPEVAFFNSVVYTYQPLLRSDPHVSSSTYDLF